MAASSTVRRSGRGRIPNTKYSNNAIEGLDGLISDSERDVGARSIEHENPDDDDFSIEEAAVEVNQLEQNEEPADDLSDGSAVVTPDEDHENSESLHSGLDSEALTGPSRSKRSLVKPRLSGSRRISKISDSHLHSRGVHEVRHSDGKENYWKCLFGTGTEDLAQVAQSTNQWAGELTLPKRGKENSLGGMCHFFSHTPENRQMEATVGWDWYYDRGRGWFAEIQTTRCLSLEEGANYVPQLKKSSHSFLLGPYGKQKVFELSRMECLELDEAWNTATAAEDQNSEPSEDPSKGKRTGWMLNAGTSIRCLDWAANHDGNVQYLAIATSQPKNVTNQGPSKAAPAFTPSPPSPSCVQLWAFAASKTPGCRSSLDSIRIPELRLLICTEWGDPKYLKWCPMPRLSREEESRGKIPVGLLAGVWGDGHARVLDIEIDKDSGLTTRYVKYHQAAFTARPPSTLCTSLAWLSATDLAVGCSNGFLAIYDISSPNAQSEAPSSSPSTTPISPTPYLYIPIHRTYILALISAYPSHPHLLASSSMDGHLRLTDLRSPHVDYVLSLRTRLPPTVLAYSDPLLSIISYEETDTLRAWPLRRFFSSVAFARAPAMTLTLATGTFHPTVLAGCADGSVVAVNPMRKVLDRKVAQYQQTVFRHEWVRKGDEGDGMSRITEGYKIESTAVIKGTGEKQKGKEGLPFVTIYEEETAVTQVGWNPNLSCGGWVAVGMGSGLVRVQDLAI